MGAMEFVKSVATLGPIFALLALGLAITLHSGDTEPAGGRVLCRRAADVSRALLLLGIGLVGLVALQPLVGFHAELLR